MQPGKETGSRLGKHVLPNSGGRDHPISSKCKHNVRVTKKMTHSGTQKCEAKASQLAEKNPDGLFQDLWHGNVDNLLFAVMSAVPSLFFHVTHQRYLHVVHTCLHSSLSQMLQVFLSRYCCLSQNSLRIVSLLSRRRRFSTLSLSLFTFSRLLPCTSTFSSCALDLPRPPPSEMICLLCCCDGTLPLSSSNVA